MTTDRLFVIMLVILIPMTGCFGAVDNADAEQNDSDTIVNNYYYNNTTTIVETPVIEKFTAGGMVDFDLDDYTEEPNQYYRKYSPYNFSTNAGEFVTFHYFRIDGYVDSPRIITICDDGTEAYITQLWQASDESNAWGSHANCVHTVELRTWNWNTYGDDYESGERYMAWNLVYSIESLTVV